jgi:hypothetical protein
LRSAWAVFRFICLLLKSEPNHDNTLRYDTRHYCNNFFNILVLFTCGLGREGQLGHGDKQNQLAPKQVTTVDTSTFVNIAAGATHTVALDETGRVWCVGNDSVKWEEMKKLRDTRIVSAACGDGFTVAVSEDGRLYSWGVAEYGQLGHHEQVHLLRSSSSHQQIT